MQTQRYFPTDVSRVRLPTFAAGKRAHAAVLDRSEECHRLAAASDRDGLAAAELELAQSAGRVWQLTAEELDTLTECYDGLLSFRGAAADAAPVAVEE